MGRVKALEDLGAPLIMLLTKRMKRTGLKLTCLTRESEQSVVLCGVSFSLMSFARIV